MSMADRKQRGARSPEAASVHVCVDADTVSSSSRHTRAGLSHTHGSARLAYAEQGPGASHMRVPGVSHTHALRSTHVMDILPDDAAGMTHRNEAVSSYGSRAGTPSGRDAAAWMDLSPQRYGRAPGYTRPLGHDSATDASGQGGPGHHGFSPVPGVSDPYRPSDSPPEDTDSTARLRQALEEKELFVLELQAAHMSELVGLRATVNEQADTIEAQQREMDRLQHALREAGNRSMAAVLTVDDTNTKLREELEKVRLQLRLAQDNYKELAQATKQGKAAATIASLQSELATVRTELDAVRKELTTRVRDLAARDAEMETVRAHVATQQTQVRALHEQLAGFIRKEAADTARAQEAETERDKLRTELDKRLNQLAKVVKALSAAKDREAATSAALEAQSVNVGTLQTQLAAAQAESERARSEADILKRQHAEFLSRFDSMQERIDTLEDERAASDEVVAAASSSAEQLTALTAALQSCRSENEALSTALVNARADARRETLQLQRLADDRQAAIQALQADLSAATAAIASFSAGSSAPPASAVSFKSTAAANLESTAHDSIVLPRSTARRRGQGVGSTGGKPIRVSSVIAALGGGAAEDSATASPAGASEGNVADMMQLRLASESLSRRLQAEKERTQRLEREQDELLATNEQLRHALQQRGPPTSNMHTTLPAGIDHTPASKCISMLWQELCAADGAFRSFEKLLVAVRRLLSILRAHLEGNPADVLDDSEARAADPLSKISTSSRFADAWPVILSTKTALDLRLEAQPDWIDPTSLREQLHAVTSDVNLMRADIQDHAAASVGDGCATQ